MQTTSDGYTGRDNLEVMQEAENYNRWLCDLVTGNAQRGEALIDFGAGSGTFAKAVQQRGHVVQCVEPDQVLRDSLVADGMLALPSIDDVPAGSAAFIYSLNVLEHIEDDAAACRTLASRLRSGGVLLIYVPAFQSLYSSMDRKVGHYRRYRLQPLKQMVLASGLRVREARYADSLGFLASLAYKFMGADDGSINPGTIRFYDRVLFPISRALDLLCGKLMGKNALIVAVKP
jgi:SAM-dependent methyltransferase